MFFFEGFEVDTFVVFDRDEVVVLLFVVTDEEVFGVTAGVGDVDTAKFGHIKNGFVFGDFKIDMMIFEKLIDLLFVHACNYSTDVVNS